jgi:hypothetical protein
VDFTREPIIETIITPKEGYKLVIRSSKSAAQEEYFVDAVEIIAFGQALFFRSLERPKAFLVPVSDYEVVEVREARMVLKSAGLDRSIKIGGGREGTFKASREAEREAVTAEEERVQEERPDVEVPAALEERTEVRLEKKGGRRRHYRKRKGREEREGEKEVEPIIAPLEDEKISIPLPEKGAEVGEETAAPLSSTLFSSLLQPPPRLISETIKLYRQDELFKDAFYLTEEEQYKPHDKVQELLNEEEEAPPSSEPIFEPQEQPSELPPSVPEKGPPEDEPEPGLPLHPEEDTNITSMEPPYFSEQEEVRKNNHHPSHNEQT